MTMQMRGDRSRETARWARHTLVALASGMALLVSGMVQLAAPASAHADEGVTSSAVNPNFASENLNRYFSLVTSSAPGTAQRTAHIRYVSMNDESNGFVGQTAATWITPGVGLSIPAGRAPFAGGTQYRNPNGLGVTEDGVFYFTNQYRQSVSADDATKHEFVDVWKYESGAVTGQNTALERVVTGVDLGVSTHATDPQQVVAGAFSAFDNSFYFGIYSSIGTAADGRIELQLYRATAAGGPWSAGFIGTARTPHGAFLAGTNGDFAFDSAGNLTFLVSASGNPAAAFLGTIDSQSIAAASVSSPADFEDFTMSQKLNFSTGLPGGQSNGMVFARSGQLIVQASRHQYLLNPTSFAQTASMPNLDIFPPGQGSAFLTTDLAGFASPPTVKVSKDVLARLNLDDQFVLRMGKGNDFQSVTTNGRDGDPTATGVQGRALGPVGAYAGDVVTLGEGLADGSSTLDVSAYNPQFQCVNLDDGVPLTLNDTANNFERTLTVPLTPAGSWKGPRVECTITNDGRLAALEVSKSADPASGSSVTEGQTVTYTLTFDNHQGTADATGIVYTDHLADVLDDADLVAHSVRVQDVSDPAAPLDVTEGFHAVINEAASTVVISGSADAAMTPATVPAGKTYAVSYQVVVKPNLQADGTPRENGPDTTAFSMSNFLVEGENRPPSECVPPGEGSTSLCTEHAVRAWTAVKKDSRPVSGATLHAGGNIYYSLQIQKSDERYPVNGVVLSDDLTDVLTAAEWDPAAPDLSGRGALTRGIYFFDAQQNLLPDLTINKDQLPDGTTLDDWVPAPHKSGSKWTLTSRAFDLPAGAESAQLWFAVKIKSPLAIEPGTVFTNTFSAAAAAGEPMANQCRTGDAASHVAACEVGHSVAEDFFAIRKDGRGTLADGSTGYLQDLIGHKFELRTDDNGAMSSEQPANACTDWNTPPQQGANEKCWRFYPIASGEQAGRWRADKVPAGTYWLLETQAPNAQRVDATTTRPVTGVQLLAEPIQFRVAGVADAGTPAPGDPDRKVVSGQVDVFNPRSPGDLLGRCSADDEPMRIAACVHPTGYLMAVNDPGILPLPLSGGLGTGLLTIGALLLIGGGSAAAVIRRRGLSSTAK